MSRGKGRTEALNVERTGQTTTGSPTGSNAHGDRVPVVCAGQRHGQEGSSPSGARMRGAVSERGGKASRAGERKVWRTLNGHEGESRTQPRGTWSHLSQPGGQGVRREAGSEGPEETYRAVVDGGHPVTNRSAKGGVRSSPH